LISTYLEKCKRFIKTVFLSEEMLIIERRLHYHYPLPDHGKGSLTGSIIFLKKTKKPPMIS